MRGRCSSKARRAFVLVLAVASFANAQSEPPSIETAELLFREGRDSMKRGDYDAACSKFDESQRQSPALGTLLNLALCEESRGRVGRAFSLLVEFLKSAPPEDDRRALVAEHANELGPRVPRLILVPGTCKLERCSVVLDGEKVALGPTSTSLPVDPGEHVLVVSAPGHPLREVRVRLAEGQTSVETLHPGTIAAQEQHVARVPPRSEPPQDRQQPSRTAAYVVGGLGAASLATSLVTGLLALDRWKTVDQHCTRDTCDSSRALDANEQGRAFSVVSTITFAAGVLGVGSATFLYFSATMPNDANSGQRNRSSVALAVATRF